MMPISFRSRHTFITPRSRLLRLTLLNVALLVVLGTIGGCGNRNHTAEKIAQDSKQAEDFDNSLTFNAVTLEEFDHQGRLWWKVKAAEASYSKDKKRNVGNIIGV